MGEGDGSPRLESECTCGERKRWQPSSANRDDVHMECENCETRYALSITRLTQGSR